jgi:hypothetical protein
MKSLPKYALMLVVLLAAGTAASSELRAAPYERAPQIADLAIGSPHSPAPAVPAGDIVDRQRDARPR